MESLVERLKEHRKIMWGVPMKVPGTYQAISIELLNEAIDALDSSPPNLSPCPFCGGKASAEGRVTYSEGHEAWWSDGTRIREAFFVNCVSCGCDNKGLTGRQTRDDAIAAWNRRATDPEAASTIEAQADRRPITEEMVEAGALAIRRDHAVNAFAAERMARAVLQAALEPK